MKRVKWVDRTLVLSPYSIGLCTSAKQFKREMKRLKVPEAECEEWVKEGMEGKVHFFKSVGQRSRCCIVCIWKRKGMLEVGIQGLIIHEAVHVWQAIRGFIGEDTPSTEFEAYSIQSIAQSLLEAYYGA